MANSTPNMNLTLNVVGTTTDPTWSNNINADWTIIDSHNHTSGSGVQITPPAININSDLSFAFNNATNIRSWRMQNNAATLTGASDNNCGYFVNGNFYVNNASGTAIQITTGSGLNFSSLGTIGGDYGQPGVPAAVTYSNTTKYYTFTQSSGVTAPINTSTLSIAYASSGAQAVSIAAPSAVTAYTITLPGAVPTINPSALVVSTSGVGSYSALSSGQTTVTFSSGGGLLGPGVSVASFPVIWSRIGNIVTVSGTFAFTSAPSSAQASCLLTVPVALTGSFSDIYQAQGTTSMYSSNAVIGGAGFVQSTAGSNTVLLSWYLQGVPTSGNGFCCYTYQYKIQ